MGRRVCVLEQSCPRARLGRAGPTWEGGVVGRCVWVERYLGCCGWGFVVVDFGGCSCVQRVYAVGSLGWNTQSLSVCGADTAALLEADVGGLVRDVPHKSRWTVSRYYGVTGRPFAPHHTALLLEAYVDGVVRDVPHRQHHPLRQRHVAVAEVERRGGAQLLFQVLRGQGGGCGVNTRRLRRLRDGVAVVGCDQPPCM